MNRIVSIGPGLHVRTGKPQPRREAIARHVSEMLYPRVPEGCVPVERWNADRQCWETRLVPAPQGGR